MPVLAENPKATHHAYVIRDAGKCLHYYFYFIDLILGLCYLRVATWRPFRLQFYFNGHAWLAAQLRQKGIAFAVLDNAFAHIADYAVTNQLVEQFDPAQLHQSLDAFAQQFCPVIQRLKLSYQRSI